MDLNFNHLNLKPHEVDFIIYHGNCSDGYGCVISAELYRKEKYPEKQIIYYPGIYGKPPPDVKNKNVLICDFSYKKDLMVNIIKNANKYAILDHHKTAENELIDIPNENKVFNMNYSGAYITWKFFHSDKQVPKLIEYIQDNDLWKKQLPNTLEFTAYMFSLPMTIEDYSKLLDDDFIENIVFTQGAGMVKQNLSNIEMSLKHVSIKLMEINNNYYMVGYLNSTILKSELGNKLFDKYPYCDFSAIYSIDDISNSTIFSLRSTNDRTDVSEICKLYGGGGHRNAAGLKCNYLTNIIPGNMIDNYIAYEIIQNIYTENIKINDEDYRAIILNSSQNKYVLGKYLLQIKNKEQKIQNCTFILRNKNNNEENYDSDISVIWNLQNKNKIKCTIIFSDHLLTNKTKLLKIQNFFSNFEDYENYGNNLIFSCESKKDFFSYLIN